MGPVVDLLGLDARCQDEPSDHQDAHQAALPALLAEAVAIDGEERRKGPECAEYRSRGPGPHGDGVNGWW